MHRHVLFYSNYCSYSKEIINSILQKNLRHLFVLVCVDNKRAAVQLPDFVDRVPLVFTVDRRILTDDAVQAFIDNMAQYFSGAYPHSSHHAQQQHPSEREAMHSVDGGGDGLSDVPAWSSMEMGARGISDKFSFLESSDASMTYTHNFVDVNAPLPAIFTPPDESDNSKQGGGGGGGNRGIGTRGGGASLESIKAQRDNDMKAYLPPRAPIS